MPGIFEVSRWVNPKLVFPENKFQQFRQIILSRFLPKITLQPNGREDHPRL